MNPPWTEFGPDVLHRAKSKGKPILMVLTVPWCAHCRELWATTLANPAVLEAIEQDYVAVAVDAERRPDINDRYGTGGWPTIAYLTPTADLIAQDRFLTPEQMVHQLRAVAENYSGNRQEIDAGIRELWNRKATGGTGRGTLNTEIVDDVIDAIYEKFDHRYGGWGEKSKFPNTEALDFALVNVAKRQDQRMKEVVTLTLDKMMEGAIHDAIDGGFFRFSKTPDWRAPNFEKVLDANVQRLRCYLEAYQVFDNPAYRKTAEGILHWLLTFMVDPETQAFCGSQADDADYYSLNAEDRKTREAPSLDRTIYTNWNSIAASSLLKASVVLDRPELRDRANQVVQFLLENLYDGEGTVYHYWDGTYHLPGLLADQAHLIRALIDLSQHTGDADHLLPAEAIADRAIAEQTSPDGGFFDIRSGQGDGPMGRRNRSILENAVMAESLVRLSYLSRRPEYYEEAIRTLESFRFDYKEFGYYVAAYGRAVDLVFYPPLMITVVGDRTSEAADALRRAALVSYMPSRVVQMLDPKHDPILIERTGYTPGGSPRAYLTVGRDEMGMAETPEALLVQMDEIESARRARIR